MSLFLNTKVMKTGCKFWLFMFLVLCMQRADAQVNPAAIRSDSVRSAPYFGAYDMLHLPHLSGKFYGKKIIVVAVVDDAFSLTNSTCAKYYYKNTAEIPNNGKDDDGNGYIDDVYGWNAADNNNDVSIPSGKEQDLYHGTMVAGIIIKVLERSYDAAMYDHVKILPVRIFSDKGKSAAYDYGYEGMAYAIRQGADIICCAWSGMVYDDKYKALMDEAARKGILIIAAAGDTYSDHMDAPASLTSVYAVAAVDSAYRRVKSSAYGQKVDLAAPGYAVWAPHPVSDKAFIYADGTAAAAALAAGAAAVLKLAQPDADSRSLMKALKNTASPVDSVNPYSAGKLGAGFIDLADAMDYLKNEQARETYFRSSRPDGDISISQKTKSTEWMIAPYGGYKGFVFTMGAASSRIPEGHLKFYTADTLFANVALKDFPLKLFIPGTRTKVVYEGKKSKDAITLSYAAEALDSAKMYCSTTLIMDKDHGVFADGSGAAHYANHCDCKWQIKAPPGKRVKISFEEMDTEPNRDFVWLYDGEQTMQEMLLAKFSGNKKPPVIISRSNEVLVWFVTDDAHTGQGWQLHYDFVNAPPGVETPIKRN